MKATNPTEIRAECGTQAGFQRHHRNGETPCEACKTADGEYHRAWHEQHPGKAKEYRTKFSTKAKVRDRALERLAREYPERFMELFYEEEEAGG